MLNKIKNFLLHQLHKKLQRKENERGENSTSRDFVDFKLKFAHTGGDIF